jgi:hypothetical protein
MPIADAVAQLTGAVPVQCRGAVHALSARLAEAAGYDVAVIVTQPGVKSQQNAQRQGFDLLYAHAILVKHPKNGDNHG